MTFALQNWLLFDPIEEDDLVVEIQHNVKEPPPKMAETVWFGSKPAPQFELNLSIPQE